MTDFEPLQSLLAVQDVADPPVIVHVKVAEVLFGIGLVSDDGGDDVSVTMGGGGRHLLLPVFQVVPDAQLPLTCIVPREVPLVLFVEFVLRSKFKSA